jgi:hypothetical protein
VIQIFQRRIQLQHQQLNQLDNLQHNHLRYQHLILHGIF